MIVEKQFQERVDITPLGLKLLRHGNADDFSFVNGGKIKCAFSGAEHLGDFRSQEVLQIVAGGFPHTADLFGRLVIDEAIQKMLLNGGAPWRFNQISKIVYLFLQKIGVGEQLGNASQRDGTPQLE